MSLALTTNIKSGSLPIALRSQALQKARAFFAHRGVLEVDCGALRKKPPLDANIEVMSVSISDTEVAYLHTSPEYAMKQLLTEGSGDIYFLGHVYRKGEIGPRHNPEFTMAEWYRIGYSLEEMIEETCEFLALFTGPLPKKIVSYKDAFLAYVHLDPEVASKKQLYDATENLGIELPKEAASWEKQTFIHLLLTHGIEPHLGQNEMTILIDYPPREAALARLVEKKGSLVAERFEIYIEGLELANGYHELADLAELLSRFEMLNKERKEPYPLDELLLSAIKSGNFPPCSGVSVGFDRALMIEHKLKNIADAIPFAWKK